MATLTEHLLRHINTVTSMLVYRDRRWVQLPTAVLVTGDMVAMRNGEQAPARVSSIVDPRSTSGVPGDRSGTGAPSVGADGGGGVVDTLGAAAATATIPSPSFSDPAGGAGGATGFGWGAEDAPLVFEPGQRVWSRPVLPMPESKASALDGDGDVGTGTATGDSAQAAPLSAAAAAAMRRDKTLQLCGGMGLFVLLETPAERLLHLATYRPSSRVEAPSLTQARVLAQFGHRAAIVVLLLMLAAHVVYAVSATDTPTARQWAVAVTRDMATAVTALLPLTLPLVLCLGEALGTA